jgi:hypothetical protein
VAEIEERDAPRPAAFVDAVAEELVEKTGAVHFA